MSKFRFVLVGVLFVAGLSLAGALAGALVGPAVASAAEAQPAGPDSQDPRGDGPDRPGGHVELVHSHGHAGGHDGGNEGYYHGGLGTAAASGGFHGGYGSARAGGDSRGGRPSGSDLLIGAATGAFNPYTGDTIR